LSTDAPESSAWMRLLENRFQVRRAIRVPRAALGLSAVLRCWRGTRADCRVALPAAVCHEVVVAVLASGCQPIFCDVNPASGLVEDPEWHRARQLGADVALVVHLYGNPAGTTGVRGIFASPNCLLLDDAAQALGSQSPDGLAGSKGDVGLLSFGASKHIPAGNGALLFQNAEFADEVAAAVNPIAPTAESLRKELSVEFRSRLERARAELRQRGTAAASSFVGLIDDLQPTLRVPAIPGMDGLILDSLRNYSRLAAERVMKARLWRDSLAGTGLEPVGMGDGCVPWRYVCRLPGADWALQHALAEALRAGGMHVSNWYLPAHWFLPGAPSLRGIETLAREVFQFWIDGEATRESILRSTDTVRRQMSRLSAA